MRRRSFILQVSRVLDCKKGELSTSMGIFLHFRDPFPIFQYSLAKVLFGLLPPDPAGLSIAGEQVVVTHLYTTSSKRLM